MNRKGAKVVPMKPDAPDTSERRTITPEDGWNVQSPAGTLKTAAGVCLVLLQDVHAWLMGRQGIPSSSAVARVFSVFVSDVSSEIGAAKAREQIHLVDPAEWAEPVRSLSGRCWLQAVAKLMPYVPHPHFERGTMEALMYALGVMAGEVWAPHSAEVDLNARLAGYCPDDEFPSIEKAREILGRFAVPFAAARDLWGWGTLSEAEDEVSPADGFAGTTYAEVLAYRQGNKGVRWCDAQRSLVKKEVEGRTASAVAKELGMSRAGLKKQTDKAPARSGIADAAKRLTS